MIAHVAESLGAERQPSQQGWAAAAPQVSKVATNAPHSSPLPSPQRFLKTISCNDLRSHGQHPAFPRGLLLPRLFPQSGKIFTLCPSYAGDREGTPGAEVGCEVQEVVVSPFICLLGCDNAPTERPRRSLRASDAVAAPAQGPATSCYHGNKDSIAIVRTLEDGAHCPKTVQEYSSFPNPLPLN